MTTLLISIPVLARPERAATVAASARSSLDPATRVRVLFLCSPGDDEEIAACLATGEDVVVVPWECGGGDWAKKHDWAYARMAEDWMLLGADDLVFHPGWFDACLLAHSRTRACVIGTNDMGNQRVISGRHSTHPLVHGDYLDCGGVVDDPDRLLCSEYGHSYVDDEFIQTAQMRGTYVHAGEAFVEHLHPNWGKGTDDATYRKGMASFDDDRRLYERRKQMFARRLPAGGRRRG